MRLVENWDYGGDGVPASVFEDFPLVTNVEGASNEPDGNVVPCMPRPFGAGEGDPTVREGHCFGEHPSIYLSLLYPVSEPESSCGICFVIFRQYKISKG